MANNTRAAPIDRQRLGSDAEERAAQQLLAAGLALLHRNYRCRFGELDLVAREGRTLVIVEVRLRSSSRDRKSTRLNSSHV